MTVADPEYQQLSAALDMLSWRYEDQRAFLPPSGYSKEGILSECVEALREAMEGCPRLLRDGRLAPSAAADVLVCHLFVEALMRDPQLATGDAFERAPEWAKARELARTAHAALS